MAFRVSPGVSITEVDLTSVIPAVATTPAGFAGTFKSGPIDEAVTITSEDELKELFGRPDKDNATQNRAFHSAANFLGYGNNLRVVRVADTSVALNALAGYELGLTASIGGLSGTVDTAGLKNHSVLIKNDEDYESTTAASITGNITRPDGNEASCNAQFVSRYAGSIGNDIEVALLTEFNYATSSLSGQFVGAPAQSTAVANSSGGTGNDEIHILVKDKTGKLSGKAGTILERFPFVSLASNAKNSDGLSIYWKDVLKRQSEYILGGTNFDAETSKSTDTDISTTVTYGITFGTAGSAGFVSLDGIGFSGGVDSLTATPGDYYTEGSRGYGLFAGESDDVAVVFAGQPGDSAADCRTVIGNLIDQAEKDKDFMVFFSPFVTDVVGVANASTAKSNVINFKNNLSKNSSYAAMDSGYKKMFDKFNDQFINVPLNADIAGCVARSEDLADAWFSPAGFNRGQIRGSVKLPFNPNETLRDDLYKNGINPVVSFPGEGTVLFGDKTILTRPSAFDRINVRRLFIVLEKAISTAAKFQLFEFNDAFTRSQFRNLIEPFLRDVKGRRGITDFKVVCDETNNTSSVIDRNEFVADIFVKPNRSINFISLSFIATGTGVAFEEVQDAFA
tara:strand:+ start:839 stop:2704 length:1866 start_codon:yes stop_codon:yes gene_type:complete